MYTFIAAVAASDTAPPFFAPLGALGAQWPASRPSATVPATASSAPFPRLIMTASIESLLVVRTARADGSQDLARVLLRLGGLLLLVLREGLAQLLDRHGLL